jgi:6,7-dimethyl-8-ribityllumazine synthase
MTDAGDPRSHAPPSRATPRPLDGTGRRFAVLAAHFNGQVVDRLLGGALEGLASCGVAPGDVTVTWVPGAFELPLAALHAARSGRFDAVICLGAVIRGETSHFDYVAGEAARGIQRVGLDTGVPVMFGVLTTDSVEQAMARAGGAHGNKGMDCARSALEMVTMIDDLAAAGGSEAKSEGVVGA